MKQEKKSIQIQLGQYVGEYIVDNYLPTLNTSFLKTRKNISVSEKELEEYLRLEDNFNEQRAYYKSLVLKYLPQTLNCHLRNLELKESDIEEFKQGLVYALWDCDVCEYSLNAKDIEIIDNPIAGQNIIFKLDIEKN
jgi:hypothetical protein